MAKIAGSAVRACSSTTTPRRSQPAVAGELVVGQAPDADQRRVAGDHAAIGQPHAGDVAVLALEAGDVGAELEADAVRLVIGR